MLERFWTWYQRGRLDRLIAHGRRYEEAGNLRAACARYARAVAVDPTSGTAHLSLGIAQEALGESEPAERSFCAALALDPANPYAHYNLGRLLFARGETGAAEHQLREALTSRPQFPEAQVMLAHVLDARGDLDGAHAALEAAIASRPGYAGALLNSGMILGRLGRWSDAVQAFQRAAEAAPGDPDPPYWLGNAWIQLNRPEDAMHAYREATARRPEFAEAWCSLGNMLADQGSREQAARCFERAIALKPELADAHVGLGNVLAGAQRLAEAAASFRRALAIAPGTAIAELNLGNALIDQGLRHEALECLRAAVARNPGSPEMRWALAMAHVPGLRGTGEGLTIVRREIHAAFDELCDWFDANRGPAAYQAVGVAQPFWLAYQEENNRGLLEQYGRLCSRLMGEWQAQRKIGPSAPRAPGPIRVGVVSQFFRDHSVWQALMQGWFERLDPGRIALVAFCLDPGVDDETRFAQARAARFEQGHIGLERWADIIVDARPDVLIYPEIGMDPMTVKLAGLRLAPLQATAWGHPETSGLPTIDAYFSAELFEPAGAQAHYSERLVALPQLGCRVRARAVVGATADATAWGIGSDTPLLVCPGTPFKYAPEHDGVLAEIARRLPNCRLVFFRYKQPALTEALEARLRAVFARLDLEFDRHAVLLPWQDKASFFSLLARARVFLDTIGFSGFNTALQAVQCGLPVVTREGRFLRGRLASGILRRMGMDDLVVESDEQYVALAERLVRDSGYYATVQRRLAANRHLLFEDDAPIQALERFLARGG